MLAHLYHYRFTITRVLDGDTVEGTLDVGFKWTKEKTRVRLLGVRAPEITGATRSAGQAALIHLRDLCPVGSVCVLKSHDDKLDSFGRILGTVYHPVHGDVNARMNEWLAAQPKPTP